MLIAEICPTISGFNVNFAYWNPKSSTPDALKIIFDDLFHLVGFVELISRLVLCPSISRPSRSNRGSSMAASVSTPDLLM